MSGIVILPPPPFALLLFPSLFCRARQLIFLFLNSFRTLCQNNRGVPQSAPGLLTRLDQQLKTGCTATYGQNSGTFRDSSA